MNVDETMTPTKRNRAVPLVIASAVIAVLVVGGVLIWHAEAQTNKVALTSAPKPVTVITAKASTYRPSRTYVGTLDPWVEAKIGPQLVSAYVDTVLVRPGSIVKRGEVLATLDCRNSSASSQAVAMQARAIEARRQALAHESARVQGLLDGGFVSQNEAEQKSAQSSEEQARLLATQAKLVGTNLEVSDCILRAPFDGEVATRVVDPGAFVRPGTLILSVVDRRRVIVMVDAPEKDFEVIAPGTQVDVRATATGKELRATITRRAPKADAETRTVHFEIDLADPDRQLPVGTTGRVRINVGKPVPTTRVPLYSASVTDDEVRLFVVDGDVAHERKVTLLGEADGQLYVATELQAGSRVVAQGRELLSDGDHVSATPYLQKKTVNGGAP